MKHEFVMAVAVVLAGCAKVAPPDSPVHIEVEDPIVFSVAANGDVTPSPATKSQDPEDAVRIENLTVWSYDSGGNLAHTCFLSSAEMSNISHSRILGNNASGDAFTVLLLANMGDRSGEAPATLGEAEESTFDVSEPLNSTCFPLSGIHHGVTVNTLNLKVGRMVSRYDFSFRKGEGNPNEYYVNSIRIFNVNGRIRPFRRGYAATVTVDGPHRMNPGPATSVYVYENCQGDKNPAVFISPDCKKEASLDSASRRLCTFFEIDCDVVENGTEGGFATTRYLPGVKYRWYFGHGAGMYTCNFDVPRNYIYNITVNFDSFVVNRREWVVEPGHEIVLVPDFQTVVMSNGMVRLSADLYMDGVCIEKDYPCQWAVSSGSDKADIGTGNLAGYLCGINVGTAGVRCRGEYDGRNICAGTGVSVLNGNWFCQYASGSGFHSEGYGSIDITRYGMRFNTVPGYKLMYIEGLIRYDGVEDWEDAWFDVAAPKADWSNPEYSVLPASLTFRDELPTSEVDPVFLPGEARSPSYQIFHIYYVDPSNRIYDEYVTWERLTKINDSSGLIE